jgi:NarL family two-component system sensor histidine kinase LiaS
VRLELEITEVEDDHLEDQILKIVTEALSNALRHSESSSIKVTVKAGPDGILIRVSDDGIGFDTRLPTAGMGLANIAVRAERIGGTMALKSEPGAGAMIEVVVPAS